MTIGKNKTRVVVTLEKEFKDKLQKQADNENRSIGNYIETILLDYFKNKGEK